jgi:hypothetical protein
MVKSTWNKVFKNNYYSNRDLFYFQLLIILIQVQGVRVRTVVSFYYHHSDSYLS